jgi:hypothetical protein
MTPILRIKNENDEWIDIPVLVGPKGESGVHVGAEEPLDDTINVWINPEGASNKEIATTAYVDTAIQNALEVVENGAY